MLTKSKLKYIQSLSQKKQRDDANAFIAEGPKLVKELLESAPQAIQEIFALKVWVEENQKFLTKNLVAEISEKELERISLLSTPNKVVAILKKFDTGKTIITKDRIILALDTIQDPGNFGTIIRTADWFGVEQIVCSPDCADMYNSKVVQATMGSIARVKVFYADLEKWLVSVKDARIYAAVLEGQDISFMKKINEGIILIGNESKGISDEILRLANNKITIPKKGKAESLNAAVATGIILGQLI